MVAWGLRQERGEPGGYYREFKITRAGPYGSALPSAASHLWGFSRRELLTDGRWNHDRRRRFKGHWMPFVIAAPCVSDYSCVEVCPVDCISPRPTETEFADADQLYIDPSRCIECGVCVDVCPVAAIYSAESLPEKWAHYAEINRSYFYRSEVSRASA